MTHKIELLACAVAGLALVTAPALASTQSTDDDWDLLENSAYKTIAASVSYADGQLLAAHCSDGHFSLTVLGLPETSDQAYSATVQSSGGNQGTQVWKKMGGVPILSTHPARDARSLRNGGTLTLKAPATARSQAVTAPLELPSQHANLDKVLDACGYATQDERDLLPLSDPDISLINPRSVHYLNSGPGLSMEFSCIVTNSTLQQCRLHRATPSQDIVNARRDARRWDNVRLDPEHGALNEGRVAYIYIPLIIPVRR